MTPVVYAFTLGLVALLNPCGFPLLPAYLTLYAGTEKGRSPLARTARGLVAGASMTVGFVVVFAVAGLAVAAGLSAVEGILPFVMAAVGIALAVIGVVYAVGGHVRLRIPVPKTSGRRTVTGMAWFGVVYALGSLSCSLPLFLAAVGGSFTSSGAAGAVLGFGAYAVGMGVFVCAASVLTALAGTAVLRRMRPASRVVPRLGGVLLVLVGAYLAYYWIAFLLDPTATPGIVAAAESVQAAVVAWMSADWQWAAVAGGLIVAGTVAALALRPAGTSSRTEAESR